ncbi:hypothetical protein [Rhodoligotrophos defluvii]|uniref:hypothetical protein n=1 Tax=Rhodoligotrophos defluvii TaxID=2561934 RepID=UPI0010C9B3FA|nr:hypothetical protein [Rhodoligotrophos defluvii]
MKPASAAGPERRAGWSVASGVLGIIVMLLTTMPAAADAVEPYQGASQAAPKGDRPTMQAPGAPREDLALPPVHYGEEGLPPPVAETRRAMIEAATTGEIEQLAAVFAARNEVMPQLQNQPVRDPVAYWRSISIDGTGRDILAEVLKVLRSGYVHVNVGQPDETYVWPYHSVYPIDRLDPQQQVELYALMRPQEVREMDPAEGYTGYRIGIAPNGSVRYFKLAD